MNAATRGRVLMLLENNAYRYDSRPRREAQTLLRADYAVSVICPLPPGGKHYEVLDGVKLYQFPMLRTAPTTLGYIGEYAYAMIIMSVLSLVVLIREGFDIVHAHNPPDTFFFLAAFYRLLGKHFIYDHHDLSPEIYRYGRFDEESNWFVYRTLIVCEQLTCRVANCVIVTNESYKTIDIERGRVPTQRIFVVRNAPLRKHLRDVEPDAAVRSAATTVIGYVGQIGRQDGLDYLLRALHHLVYDLKYQDISCVIIGDGDMLPELKSMAQELHISSYVWFVGWVWEESRVRRYLASVDVCVDPDPSNPYNDRCTMIKMMEYMAAGKPIVAFDMPEHRYTAREAAAYARPNDVYDFARQIALLIDDAERRRTMGQFGRQRLEQELLWEYQEPHLLQAYESLAPALRTKT
jgi:glycosyltransferase involved in cell wall biosynthesis